MRVIVTRPARDAASWVNGMNAAGLDAVALPLIAVASVEDQEPLREAWGRISSYTAVMFVSGNAVEHFLLKNRLQTPYSLRQQLLKVEHGQQAPAQFKP